MNKKLLSLLVAGLLALPLSAMAETAQEIVKKASLVAYYSGDDGSAQMLMKVYRKGEAEPLKKLFYMIKKDIEEGGKQMFFTYFVKPSDIKQTTFLVHKFIDQDDYRRLYIPSSDKVLAIAGSRKQDPFMGSDFSYEDVSGRHFERDNHTQVGQENKGGKDCYVIESVPKVKEDQIAKMKSWIDKSSHVPMRVEFYDHEGKLYKYYESEDVQNVQGFATIMKRTMTSPLAGTKTEILVNPKKVQYNLGLSEDLFSERSLRKPPMQVLQ